MKKLRNFITKKKRIQVSPEQRRRIAWALMEPKCDVGGVAIKYNLDHSTLLRYSGQYRKQQSEDLLLSQKPNFVEVKTEDIGPSLALQKVEVSFNHHRCSVAGRISVKQLLKSVELFEEARCYTQTVAAEYIYVQATQI